MLHLFSDPVSLIESIGLLGILFLIFAESGLFFGFFFPGDSLLFAAGFLASAHILEPGFLVIGSALAAIIGDSVGYWFGLYIGPKIFTRDDSFFFKKRNVERARIFYDRHGPKAIVLARFVPVVRTFAPILAGVGSMSYKTFITYNVLGGIIWVTSLTGLGYFLGSVIPNIDRYILPIILLIVAISAMPVILGYRKKEAEEADL